MASEIFTQALIQAVSDWQRGGSHDQKVRRGRRLKMLSHKLPECFRVCAVHCFRQEVHAQDRIWQLLVDKELPETIASWTIDFQVASEFKGGVPPKGGQQGVIFRIKPPEGSVVLNLTTLYADADFLDAVRTHKNTIDGYYDGIDRWHNLQREVVLELGYLGQKAIYSYGGYSSNRETLTELWLQHRPTPDDLVKFDRAAQKANATPGSWWLSESGTQNVLALLEPHIERLKEKKARSRPAGETSTP